MVVLISSIYENINERNSSDFYLNHGQHFVNLPFQKIVFTNIKNLEIKAENLKIVYYENIEFAGDFSNFILFSRNETKDTLKYMFLMNSKVKFVEIAIEMFSNEEQFMWIDFGLSYIFNNIDNFKISEKRYDKVRIGNIWSLDLAKSINNIQNINWYFAGGVFGGSRESLLKFCKYALEECEFVINEYKTLMWEVNIWFNVYEKFGDELFSLYSCNHDDSILINY